MPDPIPTTEARELLKWTNGVLFAGENWKKIIALAEEALMGRERIADKCPVCGDAGCSNCNLQQALLRIHELEHKFTEHTRHVGSFLSEMYAIMVDPLAEDESKVADTCMALKEAAIRDRDKIHELEQQLAGAQRDTERLAKNIRLEVVRLQGLGSGKCIPIDAAMSTGNVLEDTRQSAIEIAARLQLVIDAARQSAVPEVKE